MLLTLILLAVLFIAGLINYFYYLPTKKLSAWFQSYFLKNNSAISTPTTVASRTNMQMMSAHKKEELKRVFATFDKNGDGFITKQELRESLKNIGMVMTEKDIEEMIEKLDGNGDGLLDLDEFCELFASMVTSSGKDGGKGKGILEEEDDEGREVDLKEAFDVFDGDGDGLISVEELGLVLSSLGLKEGKKMEDCKEMIRKVDMDGDGMVNFEEFKRMMKGGGRLLSTS